jgi:YidC/Oxa1 family membrane protein insertase
VLSALILGAAGPFDFLKPVIDVLGFVFTILKGPFEWVLAFFYSNLHTIWIFKAIGAYGLAIICLTLVIKTVLFPLFQLQLKLSKKAQAEQRLIQPQLAELRKKYKKDPQTLNTEMMALYKEHGINPLSSMSGCLPVIVQMPVLISLYQALYNPTKSVLDPSKIDTHFLWMNLHHPASISNPATYLLPLLAGLTTFIQSKMMVQPPAASDDPQAQQMQQVTQSMTLFMPLFITAISFGVFYQGVVQALVLYWIVSNLFSIFQQYTVNGWGQLPILGNKPPKDETPPAKGSRSKAVAASSAAKAAPGTKVAVANRNQVSGRRARRR